MFVANGPNTTVKEVQTPRVKRPWREYVMSHENLRQYLQILTNDPNVVVMPGSGSSHSETSVATVEIGTVRAATTARHESLHLIDKTSQQAMRACQTPAEKIILNALRDGAMERQCAVTQPGTRIQFQYDIDDLMPSYVRADWLTQATIGLYLLVGGYDFPEHKFKPEARDVLARFRPFITPVRKAQNAMETVQYVAPVLALFNLPTNNPDPVDSDGPDDEDEAPVIDGQRGEQGSMEAEDITEDFGPPESSVDKSVAAHPEYASNVGTASVDDEDEDGEEEVVLRDGITYDAGIAEDAAAARERLSDNAQPKPQDGKPGKKQVRSRSKDRVTGGPSVNALEAQAQEVKKKMERLEKRRAQVAKERTEAAKVDNANAVAASGGNTPGPTGKGTKANLPKSAQPIAELAGKGREEVRHATYVNKNDLMSVFDDTHGGIGYTPRAYAGRVRIDDLRLAPQSVSKSSAAGYDQWGSTGNYLSRQLRTLMQTAAATRTRSHERHGVFDTRRAYALGLARFDVFRQPPAGEDNRAAVVMAVDMSGSMYGPKSRNAYNSACVVAQSLSRLRVPFEVHGFGGYSLKLFKSFTDPMDRGTAASLAGITTAAGGTPAGEAIAFAWARALTRPEPRRILFVLTDGDVPENTGKMVKHIEKKGGIVIGIGINTRDMSDMFTHFVAVKDAATLPTEFAKLLRNFVPSGAAR